MSRYYIDFDDGNRIQSKTLATVPFFADGCVTFVAYRRKNGEFTEPKRYEIVDGQVKRLAPELTEARQQAENFRAELVAHYGEEEVPPLPDSWGGDALHEWDLEVIDWYELQEKKLDDEEIHRIADIEIKFQDIIRPMVQGERKEFHDLPDAGRRRENARED